MDVAVTWSRAGFWPFLMRISNAKTRLSQDCRRSGRKQPAGGPATAILSCANRLRKTWPRPISRSQIAPITVELAPNRIISTIGYNGTSPGPLLRMKEGVPVTVNVVNNTDVPEYVHFHGLLIPSDVDGSEEEGTPVVPPHGSRRYQFTPTPAGTRWYHTHTMSMDDLHRGSYTGMFGFLIIEGANNPGNFDQEHYLALRDWEPYFTNQAMDNDDLDPAGRTTGKAGGAGYAAGRAWKSRPIFFPSTTRRSARAIRSA